jgi:hypothetical protein
MNAAQQGTPTDVTKFAYTNLAPRLSLGVSSSMGPGFIFGVGAFISSAVYWEVLFLVRNGHVGSILSRLSSFVVMFVLGWMFYGIGAAAFKRNVSSPAAFALGVVAYLIQAAFTAAFIAHTSLVLTHESLVGASWSEHLRALAQLFVPFAICAFLAPIFGRREG